MLEKIHETHLGIVRCKSKARRVLLWPGMSAQRKDCCSLPGVCRTPQSKPKGAIGSNGISRPFLGEGWGRSFWAQQPPQPDHGWLFLKVAWHIQAGQPDSQGRHLLYKSQISRYGIPDKWSQTTDVGLLLLYLLNSWRAMTTNTQQSVLTIHKQTGKQKEVYRLSNACWWRRPNCKWFIQNGNFFSFFFSTTVHFTC